MPSPKSYVNRKKKVEGTYFPIQLSNYQAGSLVIFCRPGQSDSEMYLRFFSLQFFATSNIWVFKMNGA